MDREHVHGLTWYGGLAPNDWTLKNTRMPQTATAEGVLAGQDVGGGEGARGEQVLTPWAGEASHLEKTLNVKSP